MAVKRVLEDYQDSRLSKKICKQGMFTDPADEEEFEEDLEEYEEPGEETLFADPGDDDEEEEYDAENPEEYESELEEEYKDDEDPEDLIEKEEDIERERNIYDDYVLLRQIGEGGFGTVRLCRHKITGELFACKLMSKESYAVYFFKQEVEILRDLSPFPGIVGFKDVYEDDELIYLVMEFFPNGDLFQYIQKGIDLPSESEIAIKFKDLLETLCYCHEKGIVHRDIKPDNILLTESRNFVLADFGQSTRIVNGQTLWEKVGTKHSVAPEIIGNCRYTEKVDVWSAGILLCYLLTRTPPFRGTDRELREAIQKKEINFDDGTWTNVSPLAKDLISIMLTKDQNERPSAKEVLRHPWFYTVRPTLETEPSGCSTQVKACQQQQQRCCFAV